MSHADVYLANNKHLTDLAQALSVSNVLHASGLPGNADGRWHSMGCSGRSLQGPCQHDIADMTRGYCT